MRIKQLQISGFKSFCDQTRISFDSEVTAVVGPNGCGKSNIVDAIRWALGEQSAKNLRGRAMDDVIFNGSDSRSQQAMAEVTVTFDNTDGLSDPAYVNFSEIAVTRRLHRDGTSEYIINKTPCRLMDITNLFLGTGGGARAYSIIEQGRIGLIVSSRSEDRRNMIEEAAGITKYKAARRKAERRMDQTRQNLARITDIINEIERNLASLNRQAKKAQRFKRYRAEQTDLDLYIASHRYLELRAQGLVIKESLQEQEASYETGKNALAATETRVETLRLDERDTQSRLDEKTAQGYEINKEIQVLENEVRHLVEAVGRYQMQEASAAEQVTAARQQLQEIGDESQLLLEQIARIEKERANATTSHEALALQADQAKDRLETLADEHNAGRDQVSRARARQAASKSAIENLGQRMDDIQLRIATIQEERDAVTKNAEALTQQASLLSEKKAEVEQQLSSARETEEREAEMLDQLNHQVDTCDEERLAVRDALQAKLSRKASLEEVMKGLESHDRAVRDAVALLDKDDRGLLEGLLIDAIECPERYEKALAAALGDRLQALIVRDRNAGFELLEFLKEQDMGRVAVLAKDGLVPNPVSDTLALDTEMVLGPLVDFLTIDTEAIGFTEPLLAGVFVVETLEQAKHLWNASNGQAAFVTLDGQLLEITGVMRGGRSGSAGADLLKQKRQVRELTDEIETLTRRRDELEERFEVLKEELAIRKGAGDLARQDAQAQEIALAEVRKDNVRAVEDLERLGQRFETIEREIAHQGEMLAQARIDRERAIEEEEKSRIEIDTLEASLVDQNAKIEACRSEADRLSAAVSDLRVQLAALEQQWQNAIDRKRQLETTCADVEKNVAKMVDHRRLTASEIGRAAGQAFLQRERLNLKLDENIVVTEKIEALREAQRLAAAEVAGAEADQKAQRAGVEALATEISELKMGDREVALDMDHLFKRVADRNGCDLLRVIGDYHLRSIPGEDTRARIDELSHLIDRMGPINLAAIDEFESESKRCEELAAQKTDLDQALEDLQRSIDRMDRDSRRRFRETFDDINEKFKEIFPRLFKGGRAELLLTDPSDMLHSGVDIAAQPPGKRLGNVELMSGGEKALTAVALLFAIFLHRPSPFCILDEVDAPLDEANVDRFIDIVHQMCDRSQFIIITHSKLTMERSDTLYGVTMEEPGVSKMVSVRLNTVSQAIAANG
ncbi:MAG: chromosome segregation protein SMC [Myxococcota bacterium]|nr:chromosome segregation protein SMC [Myxococcota bacterium]